MDLMTFMTFMTFMTQGNLIFDILEPLAFRQYIWGGGGAETPKLYYVIYEQPLMAMTAIIEMMAVRFSGGFVSRLSEQRNFVDYPMMMILLWMIYQI